MNLTQAITRRIKQHGQPRVFTPKDFLDLGTPHAVGMTLLRLVRNGSIRRLAGDFTIVPKLIRCLACCRPRWESIVEALAGRDGNARSGVRRLRGKFAALVGTSARQIVYHTDGASRQVRVGRQTIILKNTAPSRLRAHDRMSGLLIQALRYLGKTHITEDRVRQLHKLLSPRDQRQLLNGFAVHPGVDAPASAHHWREESRQ